MEKEKNKFCQASVSSWMEEEKLYAENIRYFNFQKSESYNKLNT